MPRKREKYIKHAGGKKKLRGLRCNASAGLPAGRLSGRFKSRLGDKAAGMPLFFYVLCLCNIKQGSELHLCGADG
jgi:hypothetical protein